MREFLDYIKGKDYKPGSLTLGETIAIATQLNWRVSEVILAEAAVAQAMTIREVREAVLRAFDHNLAATQLGLEQGQSFLLGKVPQELAQNSFSHRLVEDNFLNKVLVYTLAAQVGNHSCGLQPCAGTGDSCTYAGLMRALKEVVQDRGQLAEIAAVMLKVGTLFRAGKKTTGCNMEGFGAGAAATAAALVEWRKGSPAMMEKAMVLALSPTIGNPCTPRVMVAGLCATHIGGGVLIGNLAANLALHTTIPVTVPVDVMLTMAAAVHQVSAETIVPVVNRYMKAFFKTNQAVESFISQTVRQAEQAAVEKAIAAAESEAHVLAERANSIVQPFGEAVVGGSSQAVGSPTNTGRIAHFLASGEITGVKIELYAELFARRGINVPGILMGAVLGAGTENSEAYAEVLSLVESRKISVTIQQAAEPQMQRVTVYATGCTGMVEALNRGGARLCLKQALPSVGQAREVAQKLGIVLVD
ncbi:serine dehydratase|uniref:L-serine dehydratase n=1 Tax=Dendrosporobacter quercicolus TaxID=146817 RepID=A0A1G9QKJ0_9FIRM|nr:serine dehydratase [Dendrosporobacter quercicolus]NSL48262.1 serine dehydratase [Dendrosporobacter quercicolus DSM 1736]SDM11007.1 L-serine dehydratase [Dendrosporobacter quercicolus]